ncbi:MAG: hypothetical protein KatS3mg105_2388 [Gemmatales bacterium]|nr:MAG: hypothetical protein KatS3mg105_2388 [Gemmatales bacterium]
MSDSTENVPKIDPRTYVRHVRGKDRHVEPRRWPGLIRHLTSDSIDLVLNQHFNKDAILLIDLLTADTAEKHELEVRVVASEPEPNGSWLLHCTYSEPAENKQTKPFEAPAQWTAPRNRLEIAGITSAGVEREQNEDSFAIQHLCWSNLSLYQEVASIVVADGLGGHQAGELASRLAIQTINSQLLPLLGTALAEEKQFPFARVDSTTNRPGDSRRQRCGLSPSTGYDAAR